MRRRMPRTLTKTILQLVKRRRHLKITRNQLAKIMGTSQSAVSEFERLGGNPTLFTLQRYARSVDAARYRGPHEGGTERDAHSGRDGRRHGVGSEAHRQGGDYYPGAERPSQTPSSNWEVPTLASAQLMGE